MNARDVCPSVLAAIIRHPRPTFSTGELAGILGWDARTVQMLCQQGALSSLVKNARAKGDRPRATYNVTKRSALSFVLTNAVGLSEREIVLGIVGLLRRLSNEGIGDVSDAIANVRRERGGRDLVAMTQKALEASERELEQAALFSDVEKRG